MKVHFFSIVNPWIDCLIDFDDAEQVKAQQAILRAYDDFWDNAVETYGEALSLRLKEAGVAHEIIFGELDCDGTDTTQEWDEFASSQRADLSFTGGKFYVE